MDVDIDNSNIIIDGNIDSNEMEDPLLKMLCVEDWIVVQNVRSSYLSIFQTDVTKYSSVDVSNRTSALICWSQIANQIALCFINFFRRIDEFESLNGDDRFILIKYNVFPLFPIFKCVNRDVIDNCFSCAETEEAIRRLQFYKLCFDSNGLRDIFLNLVVFLLEITEQDAAILSLLMIILLFSQGLSMNEDEPSLKDSIAVNRAQSYYTRILWNYMINKQGETKTCKQFIQLLTAIFRIQSTAKIFREFFRDQFPTPDTVDQIAPLMQTVLHIS